MGKMIAQRKYGRNYMTRAFNMRQGIDIIPYRRVGGVWHEGGPVFGQAQTKQEALKSMRETDPQLIRILSVGLRNLKAQRRKR